MPIIPAEWLPDPKRFPMRRVIVHWTAGAWKPNQIDVMHYHLLIDDTGKLYRGIHPIEDNSRITQARAALGARPWGYAPHVARFNEGSIGLTMCGCFNWPTDKRFPLTRIQWQTAAQVCRELIAHFGLPEFETLAGNKGPTILGHCEVERVWKVPQQGKIDPWATMPHWPWTEGKKPEQIAEMFRKHVYDKEVY